MQEENPAYAEVPSGDFLSLALLVAWLGLSACTSGMYGRSIGPSEPRSSGQHYAHLLGQRYRTAVDLYLFTFSADPDYKYVGLNDGHSPAGPAALPRGVGEDNIGRTFGDIMVVDVVPAGSELAIAAETHEVTALSGIRQKGGFPMGFICRLTYGGKQQNGILSEFIQAGEPAPPGVPNQRIDERIAARVTN